MILSPSLPHFQDFHVTNKKAIVNPMQFLAAEYAGISRHTN